MTIGPDYASIAVQAVLGPSRSLLIPAVLWLGWLDADAKLIAMSGTAVSHDVWGATSDGVANGAAVDGGIAGADWQIHGWALFDDAADGNLVIAGTLTEPALPDVGLPLVFPAGALIVAAAA